MHCIARFVSSSLLLAMLLCLGCGPAPVKLVPVTGKVTIQGMPLPYGTITLVPNADSGNTGKSQPFGNVSAEGTYAIMTDGKPGAPLGAYRVTISATKLSTAADGNKPSVWAASQDYLDASKSGLTLMVVEAPAAGAYDIALTKR